MIDVNRNALGIQASSFRHDCDVNRIYRRSSTFSNSEGDAIDKLNDCLKYYNDFSSNLNNVFRSTANYLIKASFNIYSCEEDNTKH